MPFPGGLMDNSKIWEGSGILREIRPLLDGVFLLEVEAPEVTSRAHPGEFVLLRVSPSWDPFLFRPLGIAGISGDRMVLLVQVVGRGTALLQTLSSGTAVTLRGPLGRGFSEPKKEKRYLLAAGGLGVVPLLYAYRQWGGAVPMELLLGVPDASWAPLGAYLRQFVPDLRVVSDDGSLGERGNPCICIRGSWDEVWACGPLPMLRGFYECLPGDVPYFPSLEARMGCGYGGCLGCVVPTTEGNLRACVEGPVMDGRKVLWHELCK
ncbi:MAG TPA: dihydroorotate dehydrogenase [Synergistaceae bacterium]|mgnify:CR=1 FL=1|nr:dihydroorotate dehydrogenase [Synergistaceae bacterium]HPJ26070.1 dihydroorotate dehydrogenase [Synergistaceae bacterium]HPQ37572.1 dihydroorotate dehydrogenase [Synergistaceae bacterium]